MDNIYTKPKLVFFQYKYDEHLPEFLLTHKHEHVKCLSEFFDVTVIHKDCDYQQICDQYQPDLTLFESGVDNSSCQRLEIKSIRKCPEIPKLGFYHADAFSNSRAGFISDMDHWGIETFFAIATTAAEHMPEIAESIFVWPNFIDCTIYRDYGERKNIPVLFTGNAFFPFYPWRKKIFKIVSENYPSLICPHPGYSHHSTIAQVMVGERYARIINASWFVPACGTVAKEFVRKHLEIPGCKACLITEKSQLLEAAGFVDMKNCVFADEHNILDKLAWLFQTPDLLNAIIDAGYQLVHSRHTMTHRDQIFQWFNLNKNLKPDQRIVQLNPFDSLIVVQTASGMKNSHAISNGLHLSLLHQGDEKLWGGKYEEAEVFYLKCINYMRWMPEPKFRLALCNLYKGNAKKAHSWIAELIEFILAEYKATDPDPIEWAYFIISFLCLGKLDVAIKCASQFPWLRHQELDRSRWATNVLKNRGISMPLLKDDKLKHRCSIHQMPSRSFKEWMEQLCIMLKACGQCEQAEILTKCLPTEAESWQERQSDICTNKERALRQERHLDEKWVSKNSLVFFNKISVYSKLGWPLKHRVASILHRLEGKLGYFLPYYLSEMRNDEFFKAIQDMTREEEIRTAIVIGAAVGKGTTESFLAGALENQNKLSVFCIRTSRYWFVYSKKIFSNNPNVKWYNLSSCSSENLREELEKTIKKIKKDNHITFFDAVLIDGSRISHQLTISAELKKELHETRFVVLDDINSSYNYENHDGLLRDSNYVLFAHNPGLRNGYAIFKKDRSADRKNGLPCY